MANDNNIKHFTAADIEKYHKGLLSNKEMHDIEKAAFDDPFLADALEGYGVAGVNAANDMAELKKRLAEKTEGAKIIPINTAPRNSFKILRAAILVAFIAGAGFLIDQFGFNKKSGDIAQAETTKEDSKVTDTTTAATPATGNISTPVSEIKPGDSQPKKKINENVSNNKENNLNSTSNETKALAGNTNTDDVTVTKTNEPQQGVTPATRAAGEKTDQYKTQPVAAEKKEIARRDSENKLKTKSPENDKDGIKDQASPQNNRSIASNRRSEDQNVNRDQASNIFRGRVTDTDNNGVPFANVTNVQDNNAGTYTDVRGYFNLTYPDSVLNVQVRSIGFENNNIQLRNSVNNNQVVLQDDRKSLTEVVLSKQKPNATARSRDGNMKLEEPEPADGWENYDTYLTNNLEVPEDLKNRQTNNGEVQVSFEVDKKGEPTNIKVEKSLCSKCDKEAIRLVKEGPKWKRRAKKGRTTVTINF